MNAAGYNYMVKSGDMSTEWNVAASDRLRISLVPFVGATLRLQRIDLSWVSEASDFTYEMVQIGIWRETGPYDPSPSLGGPYPINSLRDVAPTASSAVYLDSGKPQTTWFYSFSNDSPVRTLSFRDVDSWHVVGDNYLQIGVQSNEIENVYAAVYFNEVIGD